MQSNSRLVATKQQDFRSTFFGRFVVPVAALLCVVLWIKLGIYLWKGVI